MEKMRLQPISGKFLQTSVNGKKIDIWLVDPTTGEQGTEVGKNDALQILAFRNPVATPTPVKDKSGKYVPVLTAEDQKKIQKIKEDGVREAVASTESSGLEDLVKTQGRLIETQTELLKQLQSEVQDLKKKRGKTKDKE